MNNNNVIYDDRIPKLKEHRHKPKNNRTFIGLILLFFVLIMLIIYFQSPFSKLTSVEISGQVLLSEEELLQGAEIRIGMSYFQLSVKEMESKIKQMVQVEDVHVERVLPNKLKIEVMEHPIVAFWLQEQKLYPILASGHIIFQREWTGERVQHPILAGWPTKEGILELSQELSLLSEYITNQISEITLTPIDSDPYRLVLYMEDGNLVRTSIRKFAERMSLYPQVVAEEGIYNILDGIWFEEPADSSSEEHGEEGED